MTQRDIDKIDKTVLDNFYKLVHSQPNVRLTAASSTFKILDGMRKRNQKIFNENLNYSIDRLVAGLASSRALARRGYATLLLELLKNYQVSTERLFAIASQKFGHICKETSRDNLIAYFLLISIILVSGNYNKSKANNQNLDKIYKSLRLLQGIKSYMDYPISKILVERYELFHPFMVLDIPQHAFGSDVRVSPTELLLMVLCHKKEPIRGMSNLDSASLMNLCSCLKDEKFQKRPLHPLFKHVGQFIIDNHKQSFKQFYGEIVFKLLFKPNHNELAAMGLELVADLINSVDQSDDIEMLISDHLVKTLILSLRKRTSLYAPCQKFFLSLKEQFASQQPPNEEKQFTIIDLLTNSPGSLAFDEDSKSSSIDGLLQSCSAGVLKRYLEKLIDSLKKNRLEISCARQIGYVIRRPQLIEDKPTMTRVAKLLLFHSMFDVCQSCSDPAHGRESIDFAAPVKEALKNAYHTTLDHIISACDSGQRLEQLSDLIGWADLHIRRKGTELVASSSTHNCDEKMSADLKVWSNYMVSLNTHRDLVRKNEASKQLQPITCLIYFYGLQIVEHMLECTSQLEELNQSANEVLKADPADGSWADILTDQIIAILSATECNTWVRTLCEKVFGSLLPHISPTSIDLMCDAIRSRDECDEDEDSEFDEDESADEDDGDECDEDEEDEEDEEEDAENEDEGMEVDEIDSGAENDHLNKIGQINEDSQIDEEGSKSEGESSDQEIEDEEDDEEYLDDEQMMKLDSVLADMFRLNRVAKKKKNDPTFTLRCLDLVKKVISKKHSDVETINTLLATLIPVANSSKKLAETRPIWDKIVGMLTKMPGKSKYPELVKFLENKPVGGKQQKKRKKLEVKET